MSARERVPTTEEESSTTAHAHTEAAVAVAVVKDCENDGKNEDDDGSNNDLSMIQAATLLTADCLGVGILALPNDVKELGWIIGLGFLIINLPINYYSGKILAQTATQVEGHDDNDDNVVVDDDSVTNIRKTSGDFEMVSPSSERFGGEDTVEVVVVRPQAESRDGILRERNNSPKTTTSLASSTATSTISSNHSLNHAEDDNVGNVKEIAMETHADKHNPQPQGFHQQREVSTHDFIGITKAVFADITWTRIVMAVYFTNIFLVLGDYILVMSYAVAAMLGDNICLPWAGVLASILMFAVCQLRTMAKLGREASIISLGCLFIVLIQCLIASSEHGEPPKTASTSVIGGSMLFRKFSALASIGFAMGSQKLFLNIRHEMRHKEVRTR